MSSTPANSSPNTQERPSGSSLFVELLVNIIIPTVVLSYLSKEEYLGNKWALVVALSFPIIYGCKDFIGTHKVNFFSIIGVVTVALTGGMGLLEIDPKYIAIKEAAIPAALGLFTIISLKTPYPLVKTFIYNEKIMQVSRINAALHEKQTTALFERSLVIASVLLAMSFFTSATTNYVLAKVVLVSPPGTEAFNVELGRMIALSYPVNVVPAMIVMIIAAVYTFNAIRKHTGLKLEEILHNVE
ncbi:MFS transporter [Aurantivibrio plasticivorans]